MSVGVDRSTYWFTRMKNTFVCAGRREVLATTLSGTTRHVEQEGKVKNI